jgi:hypothetical protein
MKELLILMILGFLNLSFAADNICEIENGKFNKYCDQKVENLNCDLILSDPPEYFEQNLGICQCLLVKGDFFKQHRDLQLKKDNFEIDSPQALQISKSIKELCDKGKPIKVSSNRITYRGIYRYDEQLDACVNTFVDRRNGIFGDRDRFAYPGAYNFSLKSYEYELGDKYGQVKIDEDLIDLNISRGQGTSCSGTYEQIIDRRNNQERRKSFAEKERTEKIIFTSESSRSADEDSPSSTVKEK